MMKYNTDSKKDSDYMTGASIKQSQYLTIDEEVEYKVVKKNGPDEKGLKKEK